MSCPDFIAQSLAVRTAAHLRHLAAPSYAQHVALADFYEGLSDLIDSYAEIYQGVQGQLTSYPSATPPRSEPVKLLQDYHELVLAEQTEDHDGEALLNVLAEIEALTARTLYKLKYLK